MSVSYSEVTILYSSEVIRYVNQIESHFARIENCQLAKRDRQFSLHATRRITPMWGIMSSNFIRKMCLEKSKW